MEFGKNKMIESLRNPDHISNQKTRHLLGNKWSFLKKKKYMKTSVTSGQGSSQIIVHETKITNPCEPSYIENSVLYQAEVETNRKEK